MPIWSMGYRLSEGRSSGKLASDRAETSSNQKTFAHPTSDGEYPISSNQSHRRTRARHDPGHIVIIILPQSAPLPGRTGAIQSLLEYQGGLRTGCLPFYTAPYRKYQDLCCSSARTSPPPLPIYGIAKYVKKIHKLEDCIRISSILPRIPHSAAHAP